MQELIRYPEPDGRKILLNLIFEQVNQPITLVTNRILRTHEVTLAAGIGPCRVGYLISTARAANFQI